MKRIYVRSLVSLMLITSSFSIGGSVVDTIEKAGKKLLNPVDAPQKLFPTLLEGQQARLEELLKEEKQLADTAKKFSEVTTTQIDEIKVQLDAVNAGLRGDADDEFLNKKLIVLNDRYQVIKNLQQSREQLVNIIEEHIALLHDYLKDPAQQEYKKELNIDQRDTYSLEDLQHLTQLILDKEKVIALLVEQEKNNDIEIENRKRSAATVADYKKPVTPKPEGGSASFGLGVQQKIDLAKQEELLQNDKNERDAFRLRELEHKKLFNKTKLLIERLQLDILKNALSKVKSAIKVNEADVAFARDEFAKKQQQAIAQNEIHRQEIEVIVAEMKAREKELQELSTHYGIPLGGVDLEEWARQPKETAEGFNSLFEVAHVNTIVQLLQRRKEDLEAQIALEDAKMLFESEHIDIKASFHKIRTHKFLSEDETNQERKQYEASKAEIKAMLSSSKELKNSAQERLDRQKKALSNIKEVRQKVLDKKGTIFRNNEQLYSNCLELLNSAEIKVQMQIDILGKIQNNYSDVIDVLNRTLKQVDFIIGELELTTIWQRSKFAITWEGVQNIMPNLQTFITDIRTYIVNINIENIWQSLKHNLFSPRALLFFIVVVALFIGLIVLARSWLPKCAQWLVQAAKKYRGLRVIIYLLALCVEFVGHYCVSLSLWLAIYVLMHVYQVSDPYVYILFYLLSIPYLLYISQRFFRYFARFNVQHDYVFLAKDLQWRFLTVAETFVYATIAIFFFREAFLLAAYPKSELPTILLAINFIIFQIALIFLIAKEWIISIIPTSGDTWKWVAVQVDRFYYLILMIAIAIIVMSNPYVGFGKLVLAGTWRLIKTFILVRVMLWINSLLKRGLSYVFFSRADEFMRERFAYGKTLYGFFAVVMLLFFLLILAIGVAKIWKWPEEFAKIAHWSDIQAWLQQPIILKNTANPLSIFSLLEIMFFIMLGFIVAFVVDRFVIEKIFDALLVEPGVQNTISSMVRYAVVIIAIVFGFQSVGLGDLVWWIVGALIVGIGWVIKDPMGDFIAYFIILVQRPVKIGDYIKMDEETYGVVRKITARSVVVRKKNSTTIVLPNSIVINKPLTNWNYSRGFIAFDDIIITVSYKDDPAKVKALLLKVMDENSFVLKSPAPIVRLQDFSQEGFQFVARGFLSSNYTLDQLDIASDVRLAMVKSLREHGVQIAVPSRIIIAKSQFTQDMPELSQE